MSRWQASPGRVSFLETDRLLFRTHQAEDEADFVSMHTDPEVRRWVGGSAWPVEKAVQRFRSQYLGHPDKKYGLWATILKSESRYIGCCGLRSEPDGAGQALVKLAYYLARPYWHQGLATEACRAFIHLAFSQLQLKQLFADVQKGNDASEHILQKLGFIFVDREEIPGRIFHTYRLPQTL